MFLQTIPYYTGISVGLVGAFSSIPLCFEINTVHWFNEHYVTTEIPPPEDLETWLEVGSWAWNWMEPPLGQVSFFLLALQFARAQMENLGIKPYTAMMKSRRADKVGVGVGYETNPSHQITYSSLRSSFAPRSTTHSSSTPSLPTALTSSGTSRRRSLLSVKPNQNQSSADVQKEATRLDFIYSLPRGPSGRSQNEFKINSRKISIS